jgi:hypothetical protein
MMIFVMTGRFPGPARFVKAWNARDARGTPDASAGRDAGLDAETGIHRLFFSSAP